MLLIFERRDMVEILDDNKLSLVLVVHEIAIKSGSHTIGHLVIHAIVKTAEMVSTIKTCGSNLALAARHFRSIIIITVFK